MTKCEKIYKYIRISIILIFILIITQGCIIFHPEHSKKDEKGYYSCHHNACGPIALEKALQALGETADREDISQEEVAKLMNYKTTEKNRVPGYKQIKNIKKSIIEKVKKVLDKGEIDL